MMRQLVLFAILPLLGPLAFSQSPVAGRPAQVPLDNPSPQPRFDFNISQLGLASPSTESLRGHSCDTSGASRNHAGGQANTKQLFRLPCMDLNTFAEVAQINVPAPLPAGQWPGAKLVPIPTEWPNAKVEQIPTTWPDLKILQVTALSPASTPSK